MVETADLQLPVGRFIRVMCPLCEGYSYLQHEESNPRYGTATWHMSCGSGHEWTIKWYLDRFELEAYVQVNGVRPMADRLTDEQLAALRRLRDLCAAIREEVPRGVSPWSAVAAEAVHALPELVDELERLRDRINELEHELVRVRSIGKRVDGGEGSS